MPDRTYEEMKKEVEQYFEKLTEEDFKIALKKSKFDYFNKIETVILGDRVVFGSESGAH
jgi:hypothetical protein